jgi:outer membrane protein OmpA-like peptidoglycan-associated protein
MKRNTCIMTLALSVILTATLTSCTTYDAYTGEEKASNTAKGAGIGAGAAAVISYIANKDKDPRERNKRILRDAGIGAIVGGGVGYYMDRQEAELRKQLRDTGVSVERNGDNINLIMPGNITFPTNQSDLKADFNKVLDSVAIVLEEFEKTVIVVAGFTDSTGSESYNQALSERRAESVATYLKGKDILAARFEVVGFGETNPAADNSTAEGRSLNRRVELSLLPITEE